MRGSTLLTLVAGIAIGATFVAGGAMAMQDKPKLPDMPKAPDMPKVPDMPKAPDVPGVPGGDDMMKEMMDAWKKVSSPGEEHQRLTKGVGTWKGTITSTMMPGMPPTHSECTTVITQMMGGRYTKSETTGTMDMGPMGKAPFEGLGLYGFNNATKKYEACWMDNMGTMIMFMNGEASEGGKVITWTSSFLDPMTGQQTTMREVDTCVDDNTMKLEFYGQGPDGKEYKMMVIDYTRSAAPAGVPDQMKH